MPIVAADGSVRLPVWVCRRLRLTKRTKLCMYVKEGKLFLSRIDKARGLKGIRKWPLKVRIKKV